MYVLIAPYLYLAQQIKYGIRQLALAKIKLHALTQKEEISRQIHVFVQTNALLKRLKMQTLVNAVDDLQEFIIFTF